MYSGEAFDNNTSAIVVKNLADIPAIWCFCSSPEYHEAVRRIDQKLNVTNATLVKVPFDLERWQKVAAERYPNIYLTPSSMPMHGFRWALARLPIERFVFGSDAGLGDLYWQPFQLAKVRSLHLRPDEEALILGGNAERMLARSGGCTAAFRG